MSAASSVGTIGANATNVVLGVGVLFALGAVAYFVLRGAKGAAKDVGKGAVDLTTGAVIGVAEGLGIPETSMTECEKALAEGRTWDASFACPAGTFIRSWFDGSALQQEPAGPSPWAEQLVTY